MENVQLQSHKYCNQIELFDIKVDVKINHFDTTYNEIGKSIGSKRISKIIGKKQHETKSDKLNIELNAVQ